MRIHSPLQPPTLTSSVSCLTSTNCCPGALKARSCRERYSRSSLTRWALDGWGEGRGQREATQLCFREGGESP